MATTPLPLFLPESLEAFSSYLSNYIPNWFKYYREAYEYINYTESTIAELKLRA